jgi:hypothetical protein
MYSLGDFGDGNWKMCRFAFIFLSEMGQIRRKNNG